MEKQATIDEVVKLLEVDPAAVSCPSCGAKVGLSCFGLPGSHLLRFKAARHALRVRLMLLMG